MDRTRDSGSRSWGSIPHRGAMKHKQSGSIFLGLLGVVALLLIAGWYLLLSPTSLFSGNQKSAEEKIAAGKEYIVEMTAKGFAPKDLIIKRFDTVTFINKDTGPHWPASGDHPTHEICPGFDSLRSLGTGEKYGLVFEKEQTCPFHDHLNPAFQGKIIIE